MNKIFKVFFKFIANEEIICIHAFYQPL